MAQQNSNFALTYIRTKNCNRTERSEPHLNVQQKKKLIEGCGGFILFSEEKADRGGCGCFILFHSNETSQVILIQPHIGGICSVENGLLQFLRKIQRKYPFCLAIVNC